jgi:hypothetical protein
MRAAGDKVLLLDEQATPPKELVLSDSHMAKQNRKQSRLRNLSKIV